MQDLKEIYDIHKSCNFKDKDIAKAFERRCTPQNVRELFRLVEALRSENDRLQDRIISLEQTYLHRTAKGSHP